MNLPVPVIEISPSIAQVGTAAHRSMLIHLDQDTRECLEEGALSAHDLPARFHQALRRTGLLDTGETDRRLQRLCLRIVGLNSIGWLLTWALADAGVRNLDVRDGRPVTDMLAMALPYAQRGDRRDTAIRQWLATRNIRSARGTAPDVVITIDDRVIDWKVATSLLSQDLPHLPIVIGDDEVSVGPLFIPGVTLCFQCVEISRMETLPTWKKIRRLLDATPVNDPSLSLAQCAAGFAANFLLSLVGHDSLPPTWFHGISWVIDSTGIVPLEWEFHPECGCAYP